MSSNYGFSASERAVKDIVAIGSSSFSGNNFIRHALQNGYNVTAIGRTDLKSSPFDSISSEPAFAKYRFMKMDLNSHQSQISEVCSEADVVINFAAQSMVGQSWEQPEDWYETNVVSMSRILKKLHTFSSPRKYIQFTTPEVYGSTDGWIKENFNFSPNTPYAVSRAASDWHLKALHENFGFPVIFTRAANVYGEHQRLYRIVPRVILSALTGQKMPLQGGGKSIRSFIHIDDVSDGLLRIIEHGAPGESYHISTNDLVTIHELVTIVVNKLDVKFTDLVEFAPDRPGKDYAYQLDSQKIRAELGWKDEISLSDGIDRTIKWVESNIDELKKLPLYYQHRR